MKYRQTRPTIIFFVTILCLSSSCKSGDDEKNERHIPQNNSLSISGKLVFYEEPVKNALLYFVNFQSNGSRTDSLGEFKIEMPIEDKTEKYVLISTSDHGNLKICTSREVSNKDIGSDLGVIELQRCGAISANIRLPAGSNHSGIKVSIPGTSITGETDDTGKILLNGIPNGNWNIQIEVEGFKTKKVENITVANGAIAFLEPIVLESILDVQGTAVIASGAEYISQFTAKVELKYSEYTKYYRISEDPTFTNVSWSPVAKETNFTFSSYGPKSLFVGFTNINGLTAQINKTIDVVPAPTIKAVFVWPYNKLYNYLYSASPGQYSINKGDASFFVDTNCEIQGFINGPCNYNIDPNNTHKYAPTHYRYKVGFGDIESENWLPITRKKFSKGPSTGEGSIGKFMPVQLPTAVGSTITLQFQIKNISGPSTVSETQWEILP